MPKYVLSFNEITNDKVTGGKARALGFLYVNDIIVPPGLVVLGNACDNYVDETGLRGRIIIELSRKQFEDMRWEEIWDASQRIRNMFNTTELPEELEHQLGDSLQAFSDKETAVRSSSESEDSGETSFAGLHEY
jgi:pyruvate,water dikinase